MSSIRHYDAHCHLQDPKLAGCREAVLDAYADESIERAVVNGTGEDDWEAVAELARRSDRVKPAYGLHPWKASSRSRDWRERLESYWENEDAAVGEIGLDRWIDNFDIDDQRAVFLWQLRWAAAHDRPVAIHCLQAWGILLEMLQGESRLPRFLIHSYGGSEEMIAPFAKLGAFFSISGYFFQERKAAQAEAFRSVPLDRLLVETDAPDMLGPPEVRWDAEGDSEINHPLSIIPIYRKAAQLRGMELAPFAERIEQNFRELWG